MALNTLAESQAPTTEAAAEEERRAKEMRQLAAAAYQPPEKAETAFLRVMASIKWEAHPAEDFVRAVRLALAAGAYLAARKLAEDGAAKFPEHPELRKMAWILGPPVVTVLHEPPDVTIRANHEWFARHATEYRGFWVAVRNGELAGTAKTFRELREKIIDLRGVVFDKIR
ncbi:MAG: hypothetical protein HY023_12800 [Chloroflexi bacterium]|nr:hypothetical protein [Chloroflexota bacterium]